MSLTRRVKRTLVAADNDSNYHVTILPSGSVYEVSVAQKKPPSEPTRVGVIDPAVQPLALVISGPPVVLAPEELAEVSLAVNALADLTKRPGHTLIAAPERGTQ